MHGIVKTIVGTSIVQYEMDAATALKTGLLTEGAAGCGWFADWARMRPADKVWAYTFDGIFGGFIYNEMADFETLAEFAQEADAIACTIWRELQNLWADH